MNKFLFALALIGLCAFTNAPEPTEVIAEASFSCTAPAKPDVIIGTTSAPFRACAAYFGGYPSGISGYEWTISGGSITSYEDNGRCINYVAYGSSVTLCVRAYQNGAGGAKCYSGWKCTTFTFDEDPCPFC